MKMLMMIIIVVFIAFLAACGGGGGGSEEKTYEITIIQTESLQCRPIFYGDSIGVQLSESDNPPPFVYDVAPGRKMTDLLINEKPTEPLHTPINYSYCKIYIELGTNPSEGSELHLLQLLEGYRDKIVCVLPITLWGEEVPIREFMLRECRHTIDPLANGVYPLDPDQIHLGDKENVNHYAALF